MSAPNASATNTKNPIALENATSRESEAASRAPQRPEHACTSDNASARHNASWPISPVTARLAWYCEPKPSFLSHPTEKPSCPALFPPAGAFESVDHFWWHVTLVMLCENFVGGESATFLEGARCHHALSFTEQVRQHACELHRYGRPSIRHQEMHLGARAAFDTPLLDQPSDSEGNPSRYVFRLQIG